MPIQRCTRDGKKGWRWGARGKCYTGAGARAKAARQAAAIRASGYVANARTVDPIRLDPTLTGSLRKKFMEDVAARFNRIKARAVSLVGTEDAFGLKENSKLVVQQASDLSSTQIDVDDPDVLVAIRELQSRIDPVDVVRYETEPHVTVRFGLHGKNGEQVRQLLQGFGSIAVRVGGLSLFQQEDHDVLKVDVDGSGLRAAHELLGMLPNTQTYPEYSPHITIAFLEPGTGHKYLKETWLLKDHLFWSNTIAYSTSDRQKDPITINLDGERVYNQRPFRFLTNPEKVAEFQGWIQRQTQGEVLFVPDARQVEDAYWHKYVEEGYRKGAGRAFDNVRKPALTFSPEEQAFFRGTKEEFLRQSFARPVSVEKVKLLAGRVFTELKGVTEKMSQEMTRALTDGLVQGKNPREVAKEVARRVDVSKSRALTIARTETIRAHAEGNLDALEQLGVTHVGVQIEWSAAADACPLCAPMDGVVLKLSEARGLIPRHPNCRCSPIPANVGEPTKGQKRSKAEIDKSIRQSLKAELPKRTKRTIAEQKQLSRWPGAQQRIDKTRRLSAVQRERILAERPVGQRRPLVECTGTVESTAIAQNVVVHAARKCKVKESALKAVRAKRALKSHKPSSVEKQRWAEANEKKVAQKLRGEWLKDNEPMDVILSEGGQEYGIELKTMLDNGNDKITMHPESKARKLLWKSERPNRSLHTVVMDDRGVFMKGQFKHQYSGNRLYYKRDVGAYRVHTMTPVRDFKELKQFIKATDDELLALIRAKKAASQVTKGAEEVTKALVRKDVKSVMTSAERAEVDKLFRLKRKIEKKFDLGTATAEEIIKANQAAERLEELINKARRQLGIKDRHVRRIGEKNIDLRKKGKGKKAPPKPKVPKPKKTKPIDSTDPIELSSIRVRIAANKELDELANRVSTLSGDEIWDDINRRLFDLKNERDRLAAKAEEAWQKGKTPSKAISSKKRLIHKEIKALKEELGRVDSVVRRRAHKLLEVEKSKQLKVKPKLAHKASIEDHTTLASTGLDAFEHQEFVRKAEEAAEFLTKVMRKRKDFKKLNITAHRFSKYERAFQRFEGEFEGIFLSSQHGVKTFVHEIGHRLERRLGKAYDNMLEFRAARIAESGSSTVSLLERFPDHKFDAWEVGNSDDWEKLFPPGKASRAYYIGKDYPFEATEVMSMGVELLYHDPVGFAKNDPEFFKLIVGVLRGLL